MAAKVLVLRWRSIWYPCRNHENKVNFRNFWSNVCSIRWFVNTSTRNTRLFDCPCPPEIYLPSERKVEIWSQLSVGPAFSKIQVIKKSIKWIQAYQLSYSKFNIACSPSLIFSSNYLKHYRGLILCLHPCYVACNLKASITFKVSFFLIYYWVLTTLGYWTRRHVGPCPWYCFDCRLI